MIQRIPTQSPALVRFARSEAVQDALDELRMVLLICAIGCAIVGLLDVLKTVAMKIIGA